MRTIVQILKPSLHRLHLKYGSFALLLQRTLLFLFEFLLCLYGCSFTFKTFEAAFGRYRDDPKHRADQIGDERRDDERHWILGSLHRLKGTRNCLGHVLVTLKAILGHIHVVLVANPIKHAIVFIGLSNENAF